MKLSNSQRRKMFNLLSSAASNFCYLASRDRSQVLARDVEDGFFARAVQLNSNLCYWRRFGRKPAQWLNSNEGCRARVGFVSMNFTFN